MFVLLENTTVWGARVSWRPKGAAGEREVSCRADPRVFERNRRGEGTTETRDGAEDGTGENSDFQSVFKKNYFNKHL